MIKSREALNAIKEKLNRGYEGFDDIETIRSNCHEAEQFIDSQQSRIDALEQENAALRAQLSGVDSPFVFGDYITGESKMTVIELADLWENTKLSDTVQICRVGVTMARELRKQNSEINKLKKQLEHQDKLHFVFDRIPGIDSASFIEVETTDGKSVTAGEWRNRPDGLAELVVNFSAQLEQGEAVAYESRYIDEHDGVGTWVHCNKESYEIYKTKENYEVRKLYTAPQSKPVTDEQVSDECPSPECETCHERSACTQESQKYEQSKPVGEREAFEKEMARRQDLLNDFTFTLETYLGEYVSNKVQAQWVGWQARAALGANHAE